MNSGRYTGKKDPEKTILKTNIEAAREVARQLRLRDVGGIIVCDFIDMESKQSRDRVLQELRTHLGRDRARTKAFAVSELGLIEMTRQRVRQSHLQSMTEPCQTCHGTGRVFTPETIIRRMERSVKRMARRGSPRSPRDSPAPGRRDVRARAGARRGEEAREELSASRSKCVTIRYFGRTSSSWS